MKLQVIFKYFGYLIIIAMIFSLGYLAGNRDRYDKTKDQVVIKGPNNSIQNSLSGVNKKDIIGFGENNTERKFGEMSYKILPDKKTELLFEIRDVPPTLKQVTNKQEKVIPNELSVSIARIPATGDGQNYAYTKIGTLVFDAPKNSMRSVSFPTVLDSFTQDNMVYPALQSAVRIYINPTRDEDNNIFILNNSDIPVNERNKPAPYFWIII